MTIKLDHLVVYAKDHNKAAHEFADVMDLPLGRVAGVGYEFTVVRINVELSIYFMDRDENNLEQHVAFNVDGSSFDHILKRLKKKKMAFGSSPYETNNQRTDHDFVPRGLFWTNVDGCLFEIMTNEV
ncbi:hypothetical protein GCM10008983_26890 [Lentibacillus halophilus]|uniref:VOC domain-containing protein n=1 Tax=Lentibacillus halophilus TaxID=295065 RepID=A0ABN0ZHN3_9BACI